MLKKTIILTALSVVFIIQVYAHGYDEPMKFYDGWSGGNTYLAHWIVAEGIIEENTPEEFAKFYKNSDVAIHAPVIVLHSPGGNLFAGLELGRMIREKGLNTKIAKSFISEENYISSYENTFNDQTKGECLSSCAYAFLGGNDRRLEKGSKIGFHQFYRSDDININLSPSEANLLRNLSISESQFTTGIISNYILDMGISPELIEIVSKESDMFYPDENLLEKLNITNVMGYSSWQVEPFEEGLIMSIKNEGAISSNIEKVSIFCNKSAIPQLLIKTSYFLTGRDNVTVRLTIDDYEIELLSDQGFKGEHNNGYYTVPLDINIYNSIKESETFGLFIVVSSVEGYHYASTTNSEIDRKFMNLIPQNCF